MSSVCPCLASCRLDSHTLWRRLIVPLPPLLGEKGGGAPESSHHRGQSRYRTDVFREGNIATGTIFWKDNFTPGFKDCLSFAGQRKRGCFTKKGAILLRNRLSLGWDRWRTTGSPEKLLSGLSSALSSLPDNLLVGAGGSGDPLST